MNERDSIKKEERERQSLDDRLRAYYGPALQEQPLPSSSWLRLRSQLGSQRSPGRQFRRGWRLHRFRGRRTVPAFIQDAFSRVTYEARLPYTSSILSCTFKFDVRVPLVRVFFLGGRKIRLILPSDATQSVEPSELDVLLATGLARYLCMRKPPYAASRLLLSSLIPLACIILLLPWLYALPYYTFPIAIVLGLLLFAATLWLLHKQGRRMAIQADNLMVQWLGRGRACEGLHALANRSSTPSRSHWGELSLEERIARVCGTRVRIEHERLTLAR